MTTTRVAHRYAKALMEIANEVGGLDVVVEDIRTIAGAIDGSAELRHFLASPVIDERTKDKTLRALFDGKIGDILTRFVSLLTLKGRSSDLKDIVDAFLMILDAQNNVVRAVITTAAPVEAEQRQRIEGRIAAMSGKTITATYVTDPAIIGGFQALFADTMIDASVRNQLEHLRTALIEGSPN